MIELHELTKRYGDKTAVDGITATIQPGAVTGFLGPNGAGKSTTMRLILGLDGPTSGHAHVNGKPYSTSKAPLAEVGAVLDAKAIDGGRSARNHLLALGASVKVGPRRVDEVIDLVGLTDVAHRRTRQFSLGMGQRLGIASALLADPEILILDEPVNGLDVDGVQWLRGLLTDMAAEGRTVLLSSHLMSEMELVAERLLVIGQGKILADSTIRDFIQHSAVGSVSVVSPDADRLIHLLQGDGIAITTTGSERFQVQGMGTRTIGDIAFQNRLRIHELAPHAGSLEEAYMAMTRDAVEYSGTHAHTPASTTVTGALR
ncbi:ABC transporter ATP-binding protein [Xylanimonas ulmi]|uniref:ABC-2 type transport system ATP-binding protein n=1 Tax=Xylanimonas ulmi TaxID=228973 RepID=A0A4V2EXM7_9MICO|nr:ATP-binding cassette domain-containing protein [Xylanibacterium ulmi]RZS60030.1 ABC-2 type transport system ATP-binding protein [Xylanibacterium ulmi]